MNFIDQKQRNAYFRRAIRADVLEYLLVILAKRYMPEDERSGWVEVLPQVLDNMRDHGILRQAIDVGGHSMGDDFEKLFEDEQEYWKRRLIPVKQGTNPNPAQPPKLILLRPLKDDDDG